MTIVKTHAAIQAPELSCYNVFKYADVWCVAQMLNRAEKWLTEAEASLSANPDLKRLTVRPTIPINLAILLIYRKYQCQVTWVRFTSWTACLGIYGIIIFLIACMINH